MTGLISTSSTLKHGKHYGSFPSPEVMLICMPLDPFFLDYFIRTNKSRAQLSPFPKSHHLLPRRYFQNTFSPILYRISFLFMSAYNFYLSVATFNLSLIIFTFSSVSCIKSGSITFFSLNFVHHNGVLHFLPYKAS